MSDIFISYARSTEAKAQHVAEALRAFGYSVWRDDELPAHRAYAGVIAEQLCIAKVVIVLWSSAAVASEWVQSEADRGRTGRKLVQVSLDDAALPMPFDRIQCTDLAGWCGDVDAPGWQKVIAGVATLIGGETNARTASAPPAKATQLVVLPFDNLSSDAELLFFSDGVSEDILVRLMRGSKLKVIGRTSSFQFRGADKAKAATALNATHVLDGSVRRAGARLRISAHLTDAITQTTLWSDHFDCGLEDIFKVQDEISEQIAAALDVAFHANSVAPIDPEIYDTYLRNKDWIVSADELRKRIQALERITQAVPTFADGWGALAYHLANLHRFLPRSPRTMALANRTRGAIARCLALDPGNPAALAAEAFMFEAFGNFLERHDWVLSVLPMTHRSGEVAFVVALEYLAMGRIQAAIELDQVAGELDPKSVGVLSIHGRMLFEAGRDEEARVSYEQELAQIPDNHMSTGFLLLLYARAANWEGVDRLTEPTRLARYPLRESALWLPIIACLRMPDAATRAAAFDTEVARARSSGHVDPAFVKRAAMIGFVNQAYELLDTVKLGPSGSPDDTIGNYAYSPALLFNAHDYNFRADPRFVKLCARLGLVEYWLTTQHWPDCADEVPYDFRAECEKYRDYPQDSFGS